MQLYVPEASPDQYIPDYYSKDSIKQPDGRDYNAEFVTKLY